MRLVFWTLFLFIIWIALTLSFSNQELITGFVISFTIAYLYTTNYKSKEKFKFTPVVYLQYLLVFIKNLVLSNIDVAKRVLNPKLPINPGIVEIKTALKEDYKKLILANSITLTPGTITLDVQDDSMFIHCLDVTTTNIDQASKEIAGDFESVLLKF